MSVAVDVCEKGCDVIDRIVQTCEQVRAGDHDLKPGEPVYLTGAESANDAVPQGDFWIIVTDRTEEDVKSDSRFKLKPGQVQLVVGNTEGAKHCLNTQSNELVDVYVPVDWSEESMQGPMLVVKSDGVAVLHPKHGDVHLVKNTVYECDYQKEWDREQKAERRSRD